MKDLASVIVLTYKNFENIEKNLKSILEQSYNNIEIIISDDGSENFNIEKIQNILKNRKSNVKEIKIIAHKTNQGTVKNFNNAIKESQGDYIIPLSQDDTFYSKAAIEEIVEKLKEKLIVSGLRVIKNYKNIEIELPTLMQRQDYKNSSNKYIYLLESENIFSGASTYYNKLIFEKYGYFDEEQRLVEDFSYYLKVLREGEEIYLLEKKIIYYGENGVSTKTEKNKFFYLDFFRIYKRESYYNKGFLKRKLLYLSEINYNRYNKKYYRLKKEFIKIKYLDVYFKMKIK
ncbi:MAG: glycosyltransferase family 2 protein [Cetobacterium sp.]